MKKGWVVYDYGDDPYDTQKWCQFLFETDMKKDEEGDSTESCEDDFDSTLSSITSSTHLCPIYERFLYTPWPKTQRKHQKRGSAQKGGSLKKGGLRKRGVFEKGGS